MQIIADRLSEPLIKVICKNLELPYTIIHSASFPDSETSIEVISLEQQNASQVFTLVYSMHNPINESVVRLLQAIDFLQRQNIKHITICLPYLPYMRSDFQFLVRLLERVGITRCITIDAHTVFESSTLDFQNISVTMLFAQHIHANYLNQNCVIIAPDKRAIKSCTDVHGQLGLSSPVVCINKFRKGQRCVIQDINGNFSLKRCFIIDDIIDTGETLCNVAKVLMEKGATEIFAYCTHGVFSNNALDRLKESPIKKLIITDTIPTRNEVLENAKIEVISVASLLNHLVL